MSSLRAHFRHQTQQQSQDRNTQSLQHGSRIPTKSIGTDSGKSSRGGQHVSKLAKRPSQSLALDEPSVKSGTTRTAIPATAVAQSTIGSSRRRSVTPSGRTQLSAPPNIRTPSLVSGSSVSTFESPRSLRRKPSGAIDRYALQKRMASDGELEQDRKMASSRNACHVDVFDATVLGISLPPTMEYDANDLSESPETSGHEMNANREYTPSAQGGYPSTATPSTRYTDSPFSHVPTPSSASSYSPGSLVTSATTSQSRSKLTSFRNRAALQNGQPLKDESSRLGLPPVRESSTSSSNATVRPGSERPSRVKVQELRNPNDVGIRASERTAETISKSPKTKSSSSASSPIKRPIQVPPEFAHLVEDATVPKPASGKPPPPVRPTRDGTSTISDMSNPSPVVQSDLPRLYTTYHKRETSQETPVSGGSLNRKTRFGFSSRSTSRAETSRVDSAVSSPPGTRGTNGSSTEMVRREPAKLRRKDSPVVSSGPSPSKPSRFGLFSRKPKSEPVQVAQKPKRQPSKGPTAGTGHEGYGRFGNRGRSGSVSSANGNRPLSIESGSSDSAPTSTANRPRQASIRKGSTTNKDASELDDFLRERLKPVVLRGSGSTFSANASSSDLPDTSLHPASSKSSSIDSISRPCLAPAATQSSSTRLPIKRAPNGALRRPSDSSEEDPMARYSNLAARRSLTHSSSSRSRSPMRIPPPINTSLTARSATLDSYEEESSAWPRTDSTVPLQDCASLASEGSEGHWLRSPTSQSPSKLSRKWNFFQRVTSSPEQPKRIAKSRSDGRRDDVQNTAYQQPRHGLPHYAILSPAEPMDLEEVERIAQGSEFATEDEGTETDASSRIVPYERRHSSLLPSPPKIEHSSASDFQARPTLPKIMVHHQNPVDNHRLRRAPSARTKPLAQIAKTSRSSTDHAEPSEGPGFVTPDLPSTGDGAEEALKTPEQTNESPRQPRLSPVGRIPAVVSKRDRDRRLPDNSFSRPFVRSQPRPSVKPPGAIYSQIRDMASPIEFGSQPISSASTRSEDTSAGYKSSTFAALPSASTNRTSMEVYASQNEFISFPPRKDSEQSYSSSSGPPSWMTTFYSQPPQQEDIWNEYNDLIDDVMPMRTPAAGSSLGAPFQYSTPLHAGGVPPFFTPAALGLPPTSELPLPPVANTVSVLTVPQQISRFLQPSMSPLSPDSLSHFVADYGSRSTSTLYTGNRMSLASQPRTSLQQPMRTSVGSGQASITSRNSRSSGHSRSASLPDGAQRQSRLGSLPSMRFSRDTQAGDIREIHSQPNEPSSPNLRVGALMTSKWLSFGRVLFSPAHHEIQFHDEAKVLVIDGLSSDWSYYVALSYPTAQVYNLTASAPGSPSFAWPEPNQKPPSNHRQVRLANIATPFPYPKGFFTAVLFRFPTATTEASYAACISECKRVLKPGGYLEVAVLDLDLMNMGAKARKAVRGLKTRMQTRDQNVRLRNLSDILVRLIGRRNFESVQRCMVGVPAAGRIPRSQDMSSASSDSGKPVWQREARTSKSQEFSFADLLEDAKSNQFGDGKSNDETITKMVAKVGRFWYSSCYEKALLPRDQSIWSDPSLRRECERQGTSFRMLICHAQKPTQTRRRTVSV